MNKRVNVPLAVKNTHCQWNISHNPHKYSVGNRGVKIRFGSPKSKNYPPIAHPAQSANQPANPASLLAIFLKKSKAKNFVYINKTGLKVRKLKKIQKLCINFVSF